MRGPRGLWHVERMPPRVLFSFLALSLGLALGATEARGAAELFYGVEWTRWIFAGRLAAGAAMGLAASGACREAWRAKEIST